MRITGGELRSRRVPSPKGAQVRPTAARVREALFAVVGQQLEGWSVLDAFGGSGVLGFEAWSRGARPLTVYERDPVALRSIQKGARELGIALQLRRGDVGRLPAHSRFDLVLVDPPYAEDSLRWLSRLAPHARRVLVLEHPASRVLPDAVEGLERDRVRRYGDSALSVYWARSAAGLDQGAVVGQHLGVIEDDG